MTINIDVKDLLEILAMTPAEQNIMLAGGHDIGKSRILTDYFESRGMPVVTLFLGQISDPGDLIGLPSKNPNTGKTDFLPPFREDDTDASASPWGQGKYREPGTS